MRRATTLSLMLAALITLSPGVSAGDDDYAAMLGYLTSGRLEGPALPGAEGNIVSDLTAGDLDTRDNLLAFAPGPQARGATRERRQGTPASAEFEQGMESTVRNRRTRSMPVVAGAWQGVQGVLQLDQTEGPGSATGNVLSLSVSELPR